MDGHKLIVFPDISGEHRWRLEAGNNKIQASSGEGFTRRDDAVRAAQTAAFAFTNIVVVACGINLGSEQRSLDEVPVEFEGYDENGAIIEPVPVPVA